METVMGRAISPADVTAATALSEDFVAAMNDLLIEEYNGSRASIPAWRIVDWMQVKGISEPNNMLAQIKREYEASGWKVVIDKPGFNESYHTTLVFTEA